MSLMQRYIVIFFSGIIGYLLFVLIHVLEIHMDVTLVKHPNVRLGTSLVSEISQLLNSSLVPEHGQCIFPQ